MEMKDFKDKHKGKIAFIVGAGPSLRFINPDSIKDYVIFGVNSGYLKFPDADYFVTDDHAVKNWNYWSMAIKNKKCIKFLFSEKLKDQKPYLNEDETVFFDHVHWSTPKLHDQTIYHKENLVLHNDPLKPIIGARSSIASALHIAHIMGCSPIVLLGVDCCYEGRSRYYWQFPNQPIAKEINNRLFSSPNRGLLKDKPVDNHCVDYNLYWDHFFEMNKEFSKNIIYCSQGGILDVFQKKTIEEILLEYKDRKK